jgi:hypothetical protein
MTALEQQLFNPHGSIFRFLCDEAPGGGTGRAPDAASYLSAGIAFCFMTQLGRYAKIAKKALGGYRVVQDTHFSPTAADGPGRADPVETHVYVDSRENDDFARTASTAAMCRWPPHDGVPCFFADGARGRSRTDTPLRARDFESRASTSSATRACSACVAPPRR